MSIYEFQKVEVQNNGQVILKNINLEINSGQHIAITGPSGSGKTTFLKLFNRLIEPSSGSIVFEGNPLGDMDHTHLRRQAVMVFQEPILIEEIVSQDFLYPFNLRRFAERTPSEKELFKALEAVSLPPSFLNRSSKELSGGEKQRVALAGPFSCAPGCF